MKEIEETQFYATSPDARNSVLEVTVRLMDAAGGPAAMRAAWLRVVEFHRRRLNETGTEEPLEHAFMMRLASTEQVTAALAIWSLLDGVGLTDDVDTIDALRPRFQQQLLRHGGVRNEGAIEPSDAPAPTLRVVHGDVDEA